MMRLLYGTDFRRRAFFVFTNLVACVLTYTLVVDPIQALFKERENYIVGQQKVLARLQAIAGEFDDVQSVGAETNTQVHGGEFLAGSNENVISADLQTRLKTIVETGGAKPRAVQALPIKTIDQMKYSGARIEIVGPIRSIYRAVYDIESTKPYLFISGATIRQTSPVGKPGVDEPALQAQLEVFGAIQIVGREP